MRRTIAAQALGPLQQPHLLPVEMTDAVFTLSKAFQSILNASKNVTEDDARNATRAADTRGRATSVLPGICRAPKDVAGKTAHRIADFGAFQRPPMVPKIGTGNRRQRPANHVTTDHGGHSK